MKKFILALAATAMVVGAAGSAGAFPDNRSDHVGANHGDHANWSQDQGAGHRWNNGDRMGYNDWNSAQRIDYRQHNLRRPPNGYEWRESNGQYILAAVATGLVASIILANDR
jgi:Ni/Co efflux regulator RcnB